MSIVFLLSAPRSGSSFLSRLIHTGGYQSFVSPGSHLQGNTPFNPDGYFEDVKLSLLCDQVIRWRFGLRFSFLHPPRFEPDISVEYSPDFQYDLDHATVQIPNDYLNRLQEFTGQTWDVWGLSRMRPGEKWWRAYERFGIRHASQVRTQLMELSRSIEEFSNLTIVKDPRLVFCLDQFRVHTKKIIVLTRDQKLTCKSIQSHYGPRILSNHPFEGFDWVSNHFNYQVNPQDPAEVFASYGQWLKFQTEHCQDSLHISLESIADGSGIAELEKFLGVSLESSAIG